MNTTCYNFMIEIFKQSNGSYIALCQQHLSFGVEGATEERAVKAMIAHLKKLVRLYTGLSWLYSLFRIRWAVIKLPVSGIYHVQALVPLPDSRFVQLVSFRYSRCEISIDELRESARQTFGKGYREVAATHLQKLLDLGEPLQEVAPQFVTCLLNAHHELMPHDATKIEDLLRRLESAGHSSIASDLRSKLEVKQPEPKKPWWKVW